MRKGATTRRRDVFEADAAEIVIDAHGAASFVRRRRRGAAPLVFALLATGLLAPSSAVAQGTRGLLPDPIGSRELYEIATRLGLSDSQVDAAEAAHDEYLTAFAALRDGPLADYLARERARPHGRFPDTRTIRASAREREHVLRRIAALDDGLLDRVLPFLSEEQATLMPLVRLACERERYRGVPPRVPIEEIVDVSELLLSMPLSPETRRATDPTLIDYERQLTDRMKSLFEANEALDLGIADLLDRRGFDEPMLDDPALGEIVRAAMRAYWSEAEMTIVGLAEDARELSRRTVDRLAGALPAEVGPRLRGEYYRVAYPELDAVAPVLIDLLEHAEGALLLNPPQKEAVALLRAEYNARVKALATEAADVIDEFHRSHSPFDVDESVLDVHETRIERFDARAVLIHRSVVVLLREIVGPVAAADLGLGDLDAVVEREMGVEAIGVDQAAEGEARMGEHRNEWLPRPMRAREIAAVVEMLDLDRDRAIVLASAQEDYHERWNATVEELGTALQEAVDALEDDEEGRLPAELDAAVAKTYRRREVMVAALEAVDVWLFDMIATALPREDDLVRLSALRCERARSFYALGPDAEDQPGVARESLIDVSALLGRAGDGRPAGEAAAAIVDLQPPLPDLLRRRYRAAMRLLEHLDRWEAVSELVEMGIAGARDDRDRLEVELERAEAVLAEASHAISVWNRDALVRLCADLDGSAAASLRRAYFREVHPEVYDDPEWIGDQLERARGLDDLSDAQRAAVDELAARYHAEYERLCRTMISVAVRGREPEQDDLANREAVARLEFERAELNARTERRLRVLLSLEQRTRVLPPDHPRLAR